jgi:hypothetical protein
MHFQRRQLLRIISFAFGSNFISSRNQLGIAAQTAILPTISPPAGIAAGRGFAGGTEIEKVTGIGGLFFRAHDPAALGRWYQQHLGISLTPSSYKESPWQQDAGPTIFAPFAETSDYFGDAHEIRSAAACSVAGDRTPTRRVARGAATLSSDPPGLYLKVQQTVKNLGRP